jgi:hypothetical protein
MGSDPNFNRLGIYFAPQDGLLAEFGTRWLGWDLASGQTVEPLNLTGVPLPTSIMTATASLYGFHATLKAPFELVEGACIDDVGKVLRDLCDQTEPLNIGGLKVEALGRLLALIPREAPAALADLASDIVNRFEPFRAPLSEAAFAQKNKPHLSDRHRRNLGTFGAAHVHEDFRFHMTLTDRMSQPHLVAVQEALEMHLAEALMLPLTLDALSLVGEAGDGRFQLIRRCPLRG